MVREFTEAVDNFEDLVTNTDNQDYIEKQKEKLLEFIQDVFSADGKYQWHVIDEVKRVNRFKVRVARGVVSLLIADKVAKDGEVLHKRAYVKRVN